MGKTSTIEEQRPVEAAVETAVPTCQHHWVIDTPRGSTSPGRCKRCGEERDFRNSASDHVWEDDSGGSYNAWRGVRSSPSRSSEDGEVTTAAATGGGVMV